MRRGLLHGRGEQLAAVRHPIDGLAVQPREYVRADHRAGPGAEVLGGEALAHHLLHLVVDHPARDVHHGVILVAVLKQLAPGQLQQLADDSSDAPIAKVAHLALLRFAFVVEPEDVAMHGDVALAQRRDPEAAVLLRVHLASRAHEAGRQNAEDARHHAIARQSREREPAVDLLAQFRQRAPERDEAVVLLALPLDDRAIVVPVLPAPRLVPSDGLHLRGRGTTHHHVGPGRRDLQLMQPFEVPLGRSDPAKPPLQGALAVDPGLLEPLDRRHPRSI